MKNLKIGVCNYSGKKHMPSAIFLLLAMNLSGCATPASVEGMSVSGVQTIVAPASFPLKHTVDIGEIGGGETTNPLWTSEVGNEEFRGALESSLRQGEILATAGLPGRFRLNATLLNLQQPLIGLDMRVNSSIRYELISKGGGERLWEDTINAGYTATVGDAFLGVERLRLANEGSIRENIRMLIERLHRFPE